MIILKFVLLVAVLVFGPNYTANAFTYTPRYIDNLVNQEKERDKFHIGKNIIKNKAEFLDCVADLAKNNAANREKIKSEEEIQNILMIAAIACSYDMDRGCEIYGTTGTGNDCYTVSYDNCMNNIDLTSIEIIPPDYKNKQNLAFFCDCYANTEEKYAEKFNSNKEYPDKKYLFDSELPELITQYLNGAQLEIIDCFIRTMREKTVSLQ